MESPAVAAAEASGPDASPAPAPPSVPRRLRAVALLQIAGSLATLPAMVPALFAAVGARSPALVLLTLACSALVGLQFTAGLHLWRGDSRGLSRSTLGWAVQVPFAYTPRLMYSFFTGATLSMAADASGRWIFLPAVGGRLDFNWWTRPQAEVLSSFWGVNLAALIPFFIVLEAWTARRDRAAAPHWPVADGGVNPERNLTAGRFA